MPTFLVYKHGELVNTVQGANEEALVKMISDAASTEGV